MQKNMEDGRLEYEGFEFKKIWKPGDKWEYLAKPNYYRGGNCGKWRDGYNTPLFSETDYYRLKDTYNEVDKPKHYYVTINGVEVDCLGAVEALGMKNEHYIASAFAYLWRCLHKGSTLMDLEKAEHFIKREIAWRKANEKTISK